MICLVIAYGSQKMFSRSRPSSFSLRRAAMGANTVSFDREALLVYDAFSRLDLLVREVSTMIPFTMRFALPVDSGVGVQKALAQYDPATESLFVSDAGVRKLAIEQPFALATFGSTCTNSSVDATRDEPTDR
jgi:hypothetical protein